MKRDKVGTGITRHWLTSYNLLDPEDWTLAKKEAESYVDPKSDFIGWLEGREAGITKQLEHFKLPAPNRLIVYDKDQLRSWRYGDYKSKPGRYSRTEWYLQAFPPQSNFWYLGRILFHIHQCRLAIERGNWLELAGTAYELGLVEREMGLKFSAERRVLKYERCNTEGLYKGNVTKRKRADAWKAQAVRILKDNLIDPRRPSVAAKEILSKWPANKSKPSHRTLREYISLAKRDVSPEM